MNFPNPFVTSDVAFRYARARPNYHPQALATAFSLLEAPPVGLGLDLGCGTGMSTVALTERCSSVVGIDVSLEMLRHARTTERAAYLVAEAEHLPLAPGTFGITSVGAAFHWFRQDEALGEIRRVLKPGGFLIVYTDWFTGRLREAAGFESWMESYITTYPSPGRHALFDEELTAQQGFEFLGSRGFTTEFEMDVDAFSDYLLSQSNAAVAIEQGKTTAKELKSWIESEIKHWFRATVLFEGQVWCSRSR